MHNRMEKIMKKRKITAIICLMLCLVLGISGLSVGIVKAVEQTEEPIELTATDQIILEGDGSETVTSEDEALQYLINNADSFGIVDGEETLVAQEPSEAAGYKYYSFMQTYEGIPVYGNSMNIMTDSQSGEVLLATGMYRNIGNNIDISATVTSEDLIASIENYLNDEYQNGEASGTALKFDTKSISLDNEDLIIYEKKENVYVLAYELYITNSENSYLEWHILADANNGEIYLCSNNVYAETQTYDDGKGICINVYHDEQTNKYQMYDESRNVYIYNAKGSVVIDKSGNRFNDTLINDVLNNNLVVNDINNNWDEKAVSCMNKIREIYDWYKANLNLKGWNGSNGKVSVAYDVVGNNNDEDNAYAATATDLTSGIITIGKKMTIDDVVGHEYGHLINKTFKNYCDGKGETSAIVEAFADVVNEISSSTCDWENSYRSLKSPNESKNGSYPEKFGGYIKDPKDKKMVEDEAHYNSTILSHASYLMCNLQNEHLKPLNHKQLVRLWYITLKVTSISDIGFKEFGKLMSVVAKGMFKNGELDSLQYECVVESLAEVEVLPKIIIKYLNENCKLDFKDFYSNNLDNADVSVYKTEFKKDNDNKYVIIDKKLVEEKTTDENGYVKLNLEDGNYYTIFVTDNQFDEGKSYEFYMYCTNKYKESETINTDFRKGVVKDFSVTDDELDVAANEMKYLNIDIKPAGVRNEKDAYKISWKSSDESVVTVDSNGKLQGKSQGTATITATLVNKVGKKRNKFTDKVTVNVTKKQRETVLVLDCSSSMHGRPLSEMKQSAIKFCEALMNGGGENYVEIVTFGTSASKSGFKNNLSDLTSYINNISADGSTNMYQGLSMASDELNASDRKNSIQNIVVMSDGEPCEGSTQNSGVMSNWISAHSGYSFYYSYAEKYGNAVCSLSDSLKADYNIYSLGFFHTMSADEKAYCSYLIDYIDNKGYYEVTDADNLQISFDDISGHVSNGSKIVITVACPVDVSVSLNGETLSSSRADYNESTSFGTLKKTGAANDIKVLELDSANNYDISFKGNGSGTMDYTVTYYNSDDSIEQTRNFTSVPISASTLMTSNTAKDQDTELKIDSDGDGQVDSIWTASADKDGSETFKDEKAITAEVTATAIDVEDENETEEKSSDKTVWIVLIVCSSIVILASIGAIAAVALKKVPDEKDNNKNNKDNKDKNSGDVKKACGIVVLLDGSMKGKQLSFESGKVHSIGKDATKADVLIDKSYQSISRLHCTIEFDERHNGYYITDYSSNGTYLMNSGKRLEHGKRTLIARNTVIYLAQKNCRIELK